MQGPGPDRRVGSHLRQSLRAKGLLVIVLPFTVVLANLGVAGWFDHVSHEAENRINAAQKALVEITSIQATLLNAEAEGATYLIDRSVSARALFESLVGPLPAQTRRLATVPGQSATIRYKTVRAADDIRMLISIMSAVVRPASSTQIAADIPLVGSLDQRLARDMTLLRVADSTTIANEQSVVRSSGTAIVVLAAIATGTVLIGGVALSLLFTNRVVARIHQLEVATGALAHGLPPGDLPTGHDELGRLGARLAETATLIGQHEEEHQRDRANLDDILSASPVVALRYDSSRNAFVYASPNITGLLGITPDQAMADASALLERLHPDDVRSAAAEARSQMAALAMRTTTAGAAITGDQRIGADRDPSSRIECRIRFRRPGDTEWGETQAVVTVLPTGLDGSDSGQYVGPAPASYDVAAYLVDVTERRLAEQAADQRRHLIESIFDASPDIIVVRDLDDEVVAASRRLNELVGSPIDGSAEWHASVAYQQIPGENRSQLLDLVRRCRMGDPDPTPVVISSTGQDGVVRTFETRARPVVADDGVITGTVTVSRDLTDRIRLEESLRRASESAGAASAAKSEFLSRMSHELRTPLNAILGFTQLMELDDLTPDHAASISQIHRAGHHLLALINEVLDISRIEAGRVDLSLEPVSVGDVMSEMMALLAPVAEPRQVMLRYALNADTDAAVVHADRQRLLQVLLNLGSNAVKYNEADGIVIFAVTVPSEEWVQISVTDTGPGIPPDRLSELFQPFSRLGAEQSGIEGTGVGLALSKQLMELMGGTIGVTSEPGQGSTFWIRLHRVDAPAVPHGPPQDDRPALSPSASPAPASPAAGDPEVVASAARSHTTTRQILTDADQPPADDQRHPPGDDRRHQPGSVTVLHIEDNDSNAGLVARILERRPGVLLLRASRARLGLEMAKRHHPDLVLLDLHLPDLPGDELVHRLRADPDISSTRVVVLSADATPATIGRMLSLGVEAYLTKPIDVSTLLRLTDLVARDAPTAHRPDLGGSNTHAGSVAKTEDASSGTVW